NTLRSTHSTYPSVHAVGLAEPCAKTNRRRPPQPALCPKAPAALKPAAKIAKTHPPQTQICHGISAREKCRLVRGARFRKSIGLAVQLLRGRGMRVKHDAITEGRRLALLQRGFQRRLLGIERVSAQRIRGKKSIAARVPVSRITNISRMIEDCNRRDVPVAVVPGERAPAAAR